MKRKLAKGATAMVVAGALYVIPTPGLTQLDSDLPTSVEGFAFDAADTDGDGLISEAELARDAAAGFTSLDADGDGLLVPDELESHDPAAFAEVDADGDGALSFEEVMMNKLEGLAAADQDADGYLSFDEMMTGAAAEQGVTR